MSKRFKLSINSGYTINGVNGTTIRTPIKDQIIDERNKNFYVMEITKKGIPKKDWEITEI